MGRGFRAYVKLRARAEIVIANAAECEPLMHKDREILKAFGAEVVEGLRRVMAQTGAAQGVIGIKAKHAPLIESLAGTDFR